VYVEELDTPTLIIDLDALEDNLDRYQRYFTEHGIALRPHIKTHKTPAIAAMQMAKGAVGLCCQKIGEAEVMVNSGIAPDVLIPYNIMGKQKLDRLTTLARRTKLTVAADSAYTVRGLAEAAGAAKVTLGVLVEVECGLNRTGVQTPEEAAELGKLIDSLPGLEMRGIMGHPTPPACRPMLQETLALLDKAGVPHPVVSGGSTEHALSAHLLPELNEYRIGEYVAGGVTHLRAGRHTLEQCALRVIATVISKPTRDRVILDAGSKAMSASTLPTPNGISMGHIVEYPDARFCGFSEEHGHIDVSACAVKPEIGERVQVLPVHPCPCVNEHDTLVAVRNGRVDAVWPILARGKLR
jgi:D-serine deaminase-like pyridoxal phosphate-dependent protein